ncbi:TetR/AcrR family transcriptional regulator [Burkholderia theae]|uniref:TetR/AcrR family transcriptional regulator n=1 Tax=Burkholderia theae TaxID=3143496 RepID=UPI003AFB33F9
MSSKTMDHDQSEKTDHFDRDDRNIEPLARMHLADAPRPATERGRQTVKRILSNAIDIFVTDGYGELSMRKVATRSGLSLSNLQHYFPSREDLLATIINVTLNEYSNSYDTLRADTTLTPEARLEALVRLLIEDSKQSKTQGLFVNLFALAQSQEFARKTIEEAYTFQRLMIAEFVTAINPELPPSVLARRAALITAQIEGLIVFIPQRNRFPSDLRGLEDDAVNAVLALARA